MRVKIVKLARSASPTKQALYMRKYYRRNRGRMMKQARQYYARNRTRLRKLNKKYAIDNAKELRAYRDRYRIKIERLRRAAKRKPCTDCGNRFPYYVMEFDHCRGKKYCDVGRISYSLVMFLRELAKCDVVCANCHRKRTHKRNRRQ